MGLFNRGESADPITLSFKDIGVQGLAKVRDLWQGKDVGSFSESYTEEVPRHGAVLVRVQ
jgi:alpha-galactosidase